MSSSLPERTGLSAPAVSLDPPSQACPRPVDPTGLTYHVARSLNEVTAAWRLVYRSYRRSNLIEANPTGLHTLPAVVGHQTMVAFGRIREQVVSTLSSYTEGPTGLPLDAVYPDELARLRKQGRRLAEIGLLADRRENAGRTLNSLFDLMRFGVLYDMHRGMDDVVIGVHPRHVPFYQRLIGFDLAGPEKSYATVNDNPVVLLRLDLRTTPYQPRLPRGLNYFMANPIAAETFENRFDFSEQSLVGSDIARFRTWKAAGLRIASGVPEKTLAAHMADDAANSTGCPPRLAG